MPLVILLASLIFILAVVLIPCAIYESKQGDDFTEFYPNEYK